MKWLLCLLVLLLSFSISKSQNSAPVVVDGSSTVFPILEAAALLHSNRNGNSTIQVDNSGTGAGFQKFCTGESSITGASRLMRDSEAACLEEKGISYTRFVVALDGITIVVHPENAFLSEITTEQLRQIWRSDSNVRTWRDVESHWPDEPISLYTRGRTSGTYDFFMRNVLQSGDTPTTSYTGAATDYELINLIIEDRNAMGIIGFAYYVRNASRLKPLAVNSGRGFVSPSYQTINSGDYSPLSRQLYIYVNTNHLHENEALADFLQTLFTRYTLILRRVGYVALNDVNLQLVRNQLQEVLTNPDDGTTKSAQTDRSANTMNSGKNTR